MLSRGSVSNRILERSVLKHIRRNRKEVTYGAGVGHDYGAFSGLVSAVGTAERLADTSALNLTTGEVAYIRARNNFSISGGEPVAMQIVIHAPAKNREAKIRYEMERLTEISARDHIQIMGGHTEVTSAAERMIVTVTILGQAASAAQEDDKTTEDKRIKDKKMFSPGDCIVMTGHAGMFGAAYLAVAKKEELLERFSESYYHEMMDAVEDFYIEPAAKILREHGASYIHDISCGGVYGACSQLGDMAEVGVRILHEAIPVKQPVIELCEFFNLNPYMLYGTGATLSVFHEGAEEAVKALQEAGIEASVIGNISEEKEKVIHSELFDRVRHLTMAEGDELYKIL